MHAARQEAEPCGGQGHPGLRRRESAGSTLGSRVVCTGQLAPPRSACLICRLGVTRLSAEPSTVLAQNLRAHRLAHTAVVTAHCQSPTPKRHAPPRARAAGGAGAGLTLPPGPQQLGAQLGRVPGTCQASPQGLFQPGSGRTCRAGEPSFTSCCAEGLSEALGSQGQEGASNHSPLLSKLISLRPRAPGRCLECLQPWDPAHPRRAYRARPKEPRRRLVRWGTAGPGGQTGRGTSGNCQRRGNARAAWMVPQSRAIHTCASAPRDRCARRGLSEPRALMAGDRRV